MNPDTLVTIHAYLGDKHQVEMLMPHFVAHRCSIVVMSPVDAPIRWSAQRGVKFRHGGLKGWIGPHTLERQIIHMRMMLEYPFGHYMAFDADSFCLSPEFPKYLYESPDTFWSNEVTDTNPGPSHLPKIAMQPPYFYSRKVLEKLVTTKPADSYYGDFGPMPEQKLPVPTNCLDHFFLQLVYGAGVPHLNFPQGASFETESDHGLKTMCGLVREHGHRFLHSVKSRHSLTAIKSAWEIFKSNQI